MIVEAMGASQTTYPLLPTGPRSVRMALNLDFSYFKTSFCVFVLMATKTGHASMKSTLFQVKRNQVLNSTVLLQTQLVNEVYECGWLCGFNDDCGAANARKDYGSPNAYFCDFLEDPGTGNLVTSTGDVALVDDTDECLSDPCVHGGTCADRYGGFTCHCPTPYTGVRCEIDCNSFAMFPLGCIRDHNDEKHFNTTLAQCLSMCLNTTFYCKSIDYRASQDECNLSSVRKSEVPPSDYPEAGCWTPGFDYYERPVECDI